MTEPTEQERIEVEFLDFEPGTHIQAKIHDWWLTASKYEGHSKNLFIRVYPTSMAEPPDFTQDTAHMFRIIGLYHAQPKQRFADYYAMSPVIRGETLDIAYEGKTDLGDGRTAARWQLDLISRPEAQRPPLAKDRDWEAEKGQELLASFGRGTPAAGTPTPGGETITPRIADEFTPKPADTFGFGAPGKTTPAGGMPDQMEPAPEPAPPANPFLAS